MRFPFILPQLFGENVVKFLNVLDSFRQSC